jgi:hypothetical protein
LGRIQVKGKVEPVEVFWVVGTRPICAKPRRVTALAVPLVGREEEYAPLQAAGDRVRAGVGGIVTLVAGGASTLLYDSFPGDDLFAIAWRPFTEVLDAASLLGCPAEQRQPTRVGRRRPEERSGERWGCAV